MKIKQTLASSLLCLAFVFAIVGFSSVVTVATPASVLAVQAPPPGGDSGSDEEENNAPSGCEDIKTSIIRCDESKGGNAIWGVLLLVINIMTAGVGVVAVGGIVYAGILYTAARDNASQVTKAKDIIFNVVLGLVAYGGMYALLQWLIPGGVFS